MSAQSQAEPLTPEGVTAHERSRLTGKSDAYSGGLGVAVGAIAQRELASLFFSPVAYVVGFIFLAWAGWFFVQDTLVTGNEASLRVLFDYMAMALVVALPLLTMRSIADEFATGAIESLMTAPVSDAAVILGKFLGAMVFYLALLLATVMYWIIMASYSAPVASVVLTGYLGLILLGSLFIAVGIFASTLTKYQLLAAEIAVAILAVFTFLADYGARYTEIGWVRDVCGYLNMFGYFDDFNKGIIDTGGVIFFLTTTVFFLFLATKTLESRRWR